MEKFLKIMAVIGGLAFMQQVTILFEQFLTVKYSWVQILTALPVGFFFGYLLCRLWQWNNHDDKYPDWKGLLNEVRVKLLTMQLERLNNKMEFFIKEFVHEKSKETDRAKQ